MKHITKYLESGILELYVLDDLHPLERLNVESMASTHPLIKNELNEIEYALEQYALKNAIEPGSLIRQNFLNALGLN